MKSDSKIIVRLLFIALSTLPLSTSARTLLLVETKSDKGCKFTEYRDTDAAESKKTVHATWTGKCVAGFADGSGTLTTQNGEGTKETAIGKMVKGKFEGEVTSTLSKKDGSSGTARVTYVSAIPNGHGEFEIVKPDGSKTSYIGNFKDGLPHGQGKLTLPEIVITGVFSEKKPGGVMTVTPKDGRWTYEGTLSESLKPHGQGTMKYPNSAQLTTVFDNGRPGSTGQVIFPNGNTYTGQLEAGKPHGFGKITRATNGEWYEGRFRNGQWEGDGVVGDRSGRTAEVTIQNGRPVPRNNPANNQQSASSNGAGGIEALGSFLDSLARGIAAGDAYTRSQQPQPIQQSAPTVAMPRAPGIYMSERAAGMNKICYYNNAGSTVAITVGAVDLCPR